MPVCTAARSLGWVCGLTQIVPAVAIAQTATAILNTGGPLIRRLPQWRYLYVKMTARASSDRRRTSAVPNYSVEERVGETGNELDEVGLTAGAGLLIKMAEVSLGRGLGDAERMRDRRHAAELDHTEQHAQFHWRELVGLGDRLRRRGRVQCRLVHEQGCGGSVGSTAAPQT